ncbi:hypothetical protein CR513_04772, partial [Mucuna pruriens]
MDYRERGSISKNEDNAGYTPILKRSTPCTPFLFTCLSLMMLSVQQLSKKGKGTNDQYTFSARAREKISKNKKDHLRKSKGKRREDRGSRGCLFWSWLTTS